MPVSEEVREAVDGVASKWRSALDTVIKVAFPILLAVSSWAFAENRSQDRALQALDKRVGLVELRQDLDLVASKERDAQRKAIVKALGEIKVSLARLEEGDKSTASRLSQIEAAFREGR